MTKKNTKSVQKTLRTAGPNIDIQDCNSVYRAVQTSWNDKAYMFVEQFERNFAEYAGVRYALTTSGGTGALILALASLGIGNGDEVILPDMGFYGCANTIRTVGATPVFADIESESWCIDPCSIEKHITKKTKAIMPIWSYGNVPSMDDIMRVAKENKLAVIEDACPAVGSYYKDKHAGTFGDIGCFSFQGAKIMTTGLGGMLVTNNKALYEKAKLLNNHGVEKDFNQLCFGYSFDMSDINAALGLSQLKKIDKLVEKKQTIYKTYKNTITKPFLKFDSMTRQVYSGDGGIYIVPASNCWMNGVLVKNRKKARKTLLENGVDTRNVFYPMSSFPMYKKKNNPVSYEIGYHGINIPSGDSLTADQIIYISSVVNAL